VFWCVEYYSSYANIEELVLSFVIDSAQFSTVIIHSYKELKELNLWLVHQYIFNRDTTK
jgi:hypothetical protein